MDRDRGEPIRELRDESVVDGVGKDEAWLAMVNAGDVRSTLEDADQISRGEADEIRSR